MCNQTEKRELALGLSPNNTLQRSWTDKVLARGRLISSSAQGALARTACRRAAAELGR